jgi:hypothetical protein
MERQDDREWYSGESPESFAAAAKIAVDKAEDVLRDRGDLPTEYDVRLQVLAKEPLSGYRVLVSPTG